MHDTLPRLLTHTLAHWCLWPFFLGPKVSMVDCMFAPFLERMAASLPYFKVGDAPNTRSLNFNFIYNLTLPLPTHILRHATSHYTTLHDITRPGVHRAMRQLSESTAMVSR